MVTICRECNIGFSLDEQYAVTFLSCVLAGSTDPDRQPNAGAARALAGSAALARDRIERSRIDYVTLSGKARILWRPDTDRIQRVVLKNARGTHISSMASRCSKARLMCGSFRWKA